MIFINPMWDHERERLGKQKCTPLGYKLHVISDAIGLIGLLLFFGTIIYLAYRVFTGTFYVGLLWIILLPIAIGFFGSMLYRYSWILAERKHWSYDYENCEATWIEDGRRQKYK